MNVWRLHGIYIARDEEKQPPMPRGRFDQRSIAFEIGAAYISSVDEMRKGSMNRESVRVFKALGDPNRLRIVKMLGERELCVCEIREVLGLSTSTVSKHLTILRDAGLILDTKDGKWVNFRLNARAESPHVRSVLALMVKSFDDDEAVCEDRKKLKTVDREKICSI